MKYIAAVHLLATRTNFVVFAALVAVARAEVLGYVSEVYYPGLVPMAVAINTDYDPHPQYSYSYDIPDAMNGDSKGQTEDRDEDVVRKSYTFINSDGTHRIVDYTADPVNGFNAVIHREAVSPPLPPP